jgi:hypothetical protein
MSKQARELLGRVEGDLTTKLGEVQRANKCLERAESDFIIQVTINSAPLETFLGTGQRTKALTEEIRRAVKTAMLEAGSEVLSKIMPAEKKPAPPPPPPPSAEPKPGRIFKRSSKEG